MGLMLLHPLSEAHHNLQVDLVAVHGLNGDPTKTWTHPKTKAFWLKDFLPQDVVGARVFSFGYNADIAFGNTTADIVDHSRDLLSCLIDKREDRDQQQRPIIFIAHSLGGIIVKQALLQALTYPQYKSIEKNTIGIVFLGTPHQGSNKATYGKVLANLAAIASHGPASPLIDTLRMNSDSLARLNSDFRVQLPNYQVVSLYEMRRTMPFSTLIVDKHSALLNVKHEEQIPVDANHRDMCRFETRADATYDKLSKRLNRMLKAKNVESVDRPEDTPILRNKHYNIPHNVSSMFTGRRDICQRLESTFLPCHEQSFQEMQKRFVLYGLGGSGKTQVCLRFAQANREKFWGIFWIDATSNSTVEQGYEEIAQNLKLEPDFKIINGWLSRSEDPWLLIFDNADDPSLDLSQYFPIGNRGAILITTRNPDCVVHATAGSMEFDRLSVEDAVELLIKTAAIEDLSSEDPRILANLIVETLGCLALAIVQAGAAIRQKLCTMGDYCDIYSRQRKRLLSHQPVQASSDYRFTVYTTWEVSIKMIENLSNETAENALELLRFFSVLHFDGISEEILRRAWENMNGENDSSPWKLGVLRKIDSEKWDPHLIREALTLLLSFSLISINGTDNRISMHPLVHVWVRDRAIESNHLDWKAAAYTLSVSIPLDKDLYDYNYGRNVLPHINSCLGIYWSETSMADDMETSVIDIFRDFALVHGNHGRWQECLKLDEQVVKMCQVKFGEEHCDTLLAIYNRNHAYLRCNLNQEAIERAEQLLNISKVILGDEDALTLATISQLSYLYHTFGRDQEALVMTEKALQIRIKIWGNESDGTCDFMLDLANIYRGLGRFQEAVALEEQTLNIRKRLLGDDHPDLIRSMQQLAVTYSGLGRTQEALKLEEQTLKARKKSLGDEHPHTLTSMNNLATTYFRLDRTQESLELEEQTLKARKKLLGDEHRDTLYSMCNLAVTYYRLGRIQEALELQEQTLKGRKKVLSDEHPNTLDSMYCLTLIYEKLGRIQEVLELEEQTLKGRKKVVGDEHPDTLVSMGNLAITYRKLDRKQEALTLIKDAIEISKRVLCDNHPETLRYMRILEFVKRTDQEELPNWLDNEQKDIRIRNTSSKYSKNAFGSRWNPTYWMKKYGRK